MPLNRPFDATKRTNDSGAWAWVNNPQARLQAALGEASAPHHVALLATELLTPSDTQHILPQALLINGKGHYRDCQLNAAGVTTPPPVCAVKNLTVPPGANALQPEASAANPGGWRW